jgi:hypothetical protein
MLCVFHNMIHSDRFARLLLIYFFSVRRTVQFSLPLTGNLLETANLLTNLKTFFVALYEDYPRGTPCNSIAGGLCQS